jgi:putative peptidoglycan lipid II flippase
MVKRAISFFHQKIGSMHEVAYWLALFSIISSLLALIRDRLLAHFFGAGDILDIYYTSFKIADLLFITVASLVSVSVLIPFLTERIQRNEESKEFFDKAFSSFFVVIILLSIVVYFLIPTLVKIIFPGFLDSPLYPDLIKMSRIMLLSPILLGLSNLVTSIIQIKGRFLIYALSPVFYNVGIIIGILFFYNKFGIYGLSWGVCLGALLHLLLQVPSLYKEGYWPKLKLKIFFREVKEIVLVSLPRTLSLSINQLALLFLVALASLMTEGSVSVFQFALNIQAVSISVIAVSYSVAAFPILSRLFVEGKIEDFIRQVAIAIRHVCFWSIPAIALFVVLRAQIIRTTLGSGEFDWSDTRLTAATLAIFCFSILSQGLILIFSRAYYASGNTRRPLLLNGISGVLIVLFSLILRYLFLNLEGFREILENIFRIENVSGSIVLILPLAYSLGLLVNVVLFWIAFQRDFQKFNTGVYKTVFESTISAFFMILVGYGLLNILDNFFDLNTLFGIFTQGLLSGLGAIFIGIIILSILGNREIKQIWFSIKEKIYVR